MIKEKNINNPFINLVNYKMMAAKEAQYAEQFADMKNEPKRLEYFLSLRGINFIDDTKAQSINAIWYSLESMHCPVTLIAKDIDDLQELLKLKQLLMLKVKGIVFLTPKRKYIKLLRPMVGAIHFSKTMDEAVSWAYKNTESDDAVLFCAGVKVDVDKESRIFQEAVRKL